ncbi:hypothetical protein KP509_02G076000 [Ceratopteris richardii]|nr:hypothetical protein KP509_02G076000 [Ceratopteris richardii]
MLSFVRSDLPFTLFIPRPSVLESILLPTNNRHNASHITSQNVFISPKSNAYAVISRIFGFSAVPFRIFSGMVAVDSEMIYESVSGFRLNLIKATPKGTLTVNNLDCITVDIMKGSVVVHIVDGILMDADFEQSIMPLQDDMEDDYGMP